MLLNFQGSGFRVLGQQSSRDMQGNNILRLRISAIVLVGPFLFSPRICKPSIVGSGPYFYQSRAVAKRAQYGLINEYVLDSLRMTTTTCRIYVIQEALGSESN